MCPLDAVPWHSSSIEFFHNEELEGMSVKFSLQTLVQILLKLRGFLFNLCRACGLNGTSFQASRQMRFRLRVMYIMLCRAELWPKLKEGSRQRQLLESKAFYDMLEVMGVHVLTRKIWSSSGLLAVTWSFMLTLPPSL